MSTIFALVDVFTSKKCAMIQKVKKANVYAAFSENSDLISHQKLANKSKMKELLLQKFLQKFFWGINRKYRN